MTQKQITALGKFFRISTAAMVFVDEVSKLYNGPGLDEKGLAMLALHKEALSELEKESPDADTIERLLEKMENTATQNVPKFPPGGLSREENDANKKSPGVVPGLFCLFIRNGCFVIG